MPFAVTPWNINPNRLWLVRLSDVGAGVLAELYLALADAEAREKVQASGTSEGFGKSVEVTLESGPAAAVPVSLFQDTYAWNFKVSGSPGDPAKIFHVKEFVDLDEVSHPIYRNASLIEIRARAEIDAHTHARIPRELSLGSHLTSLEPGETLRLNSSRRGRDTLMQVGEHRITGEHREDGETTLTSTAVVA